MKITYQLAFLFSFQFLFSCNQAPGVLLPSLIAGDKAATTGTAGIVFKSTDGGQTWQDISMGLPENLRAGSIRGNSFFANDKGLYVKVGTGRYHNAPNATAPFWTKEISPEEHSSTALAKPGIFAYNYWGVNLKKTNGKSVWSPVFVNFQEPRVRSVFETDGGTLFLGTDSGFFRTTDDGATWKQVHTGTLVGNLAESNGVLLAISTKRIIRSTDNGEHWTFVSSERDVAFDVKKIKGGFAAIVSDSASHTRGLKTSYDGGKTWQPIEAGPEGEVFQQSISRTWNDRRRVRASMATIIQVGENFVCAHPDGVFGSSDKGKTWKLLLPAVDHMTFNFYTSGNVIYAIPGKGGC